MIDYGILFILLSLFSGILTKGKLRRGYIVSIVFGSMMIIKLLGYIFIVKLIKIYLAPFNGFVDFPKVETLKYVLLGVAIADFSFIHFIRKVSVKKLQEKDFKKEEIVGRLLNLSLIFYALCESIAIYGLILFLIAGSTFDFYIFLILCLACLGIYFPRYGQWEKWANLQEARKPKPIWGVTVFVVFIALWIVVEVGLYEGEALLNRGVILLKEDQYDQAVACFNIAIEQNPKYAFAYFYRGIAYQEKGLPEKAISDYTKAIETNPSFAEAYTNRGREYALKEQYDLAIVDLSKAIEINPEFALAYNNRGIVYFHEKEYEKAWDDVYKAQNLGYQVHQGFLIELRGALSAAYMERGLTWAKQGDLDRAIAIYNKAIEIDPQNSWAFSQRGLAHSKKGQYDQAIADYSKALEIDPLIAGFYVNRGNAWDDKGDLERAIANYNKAIELDRDFVIAYIERGVAYAGSGDYQRAIQDFSKAIELNPNDARAYKSRGDTFFYQQSFALAVADYEAYLRIKPKDIYRILWLYIAQERGGKSGLYGLSDNVKNVDVAKWPGPVAYLFLERISPEELFTETRDDDQRVKKERQCEAYFYLGQYYLLRGDKEKAAQMFKLCLETKVTSFVEYTAAKVELERMSLE